MSWLDDAPCKTARNLFFARKGERPEAAALREAAAGRICADCSFIEQCEREALAAQRAMPKGLPLSGFWHGHSYDLPERERRRRLAAISRENGRNRAPKARRKRTALTEELEQTERLAERVERFVDLDTYIAFLERKAAS